MTIIEAIQTVLTETDQAMTPQELTQAIEARGLYAFKAKEPVQIVRNQLRRHCRGIDLHCSNGRKVFVQVEGGKFGVEKRDACQVTAPN